MNDKLIELSDATPKTAFACTVVFTILNFFLLDGGPRLFALIFLLLQYWFFSARLYRLSWNPKNSKYVASPFMGKPIIFSADQINPPTCAWDEIFKITVVPSESSPGVVIRFFPRMGWLFAGRESWNIFFKNPRATIEWEKVFAD